MCVRVSADYNLLNLDNLAVICRSLWPSRVDLLIRLELVSIQCRFFPKAPSTSRQFVHAPTNSCTGILNHNLVSSMFSISAKLPRLLGLWDWNLMEAARTRFGPFLPCCAQRNQQYPRNPTRLCQPLRKLSFKTEVSLGDS